MVDPRFFMCLETVVIPGFHDGGNQNNILEERVKDDHMFQSTAHTKTDITFLKGQVLKENKKNFYLIFC